MKKYGNIRFNRRMVSIVCLFFVAVSILMPSQAVSADTVSTHVIQCFSNWSDGISYDRDLLSISGNYSFVWVRSSYDGEVYNMGIIVSSPGSCTVLSNMFGTNMSADKSACDIRYDTFSCNYSDYLSGNSAADCHVLLYENNKKIVPTSYYEFVNMSYKDVFNKLTEMYKKGELVDNVNSPTKVTNESIGYLQDVKLNLSYVTPIKGDSIFETTNYQIYSDMIYNLKWNGKKTTTDFDLSDSYVQLYAKAEYKSDRNNTASDFFALSDSKASLGKYKVSFMELFEKSNKCKLAYLSDYPLSSADYKNGKLQACSVTSNIKYKFYIRVYKGIDKGPWLCVSEKGSHHSNEFVNSGVKVPFNVSSGGLDSDGTYKPDGNINENGNGITGTGKDKDDADADTNANDKIQTKHDSSDNSVWDNLENLVSGIASVPIIIKDIFSFLPSWCLDVAATGFALMITVCVIKFVRGK